MLTNITRAARDISRERRVLLGSNIYYNRPANFDGDRADSRYTGTLCLSTSTKYRAGMMLLSLLKIKSRSYLRIIKDCSDAYTDASS